MFAIELKLVDDFVSYSKWIIESLKKLFLQKAKIPKNDFEMNNDFPVFNILWWRQVENESSKIVILRNDYHE